MKIIVDEIPMFEDECLFYDKHRGECKLDYEDRPSWGSPSECPYLTTVKEGTYESQQKI